MFHGFNMAQIVGTQIAGTRDGDFDGDAKKSLFQPVLQLQGLDADGKTPVQRPRTGSRSLQYAGTVAAGCASWLSDDGGATQRFDADLPRCETADPRARR